MKHRSQNACGGAGPIEAPGIEPRAQLPKGNSAQPPTEAQMPRAARAQAHGEARAEGTMLSASSVQRGAKAPMPRASKVQPNRSEASILTGSRASIEGMGRPPTTSRTRRRLCEHNRRPHGRRSEVWRLRPWRKQSPGWAVGDDARCASKGRAHSGIEASQAPKPRTIEASQLPKPNTIGALSTILALLLLAPAQALAQSPITVSASLSESRVAVGDSLTLEVNVVAHIDGAIQLEVPPVDGLPELARSKSEGTSISWTNQGQQITKEYTITIELEAQRAGRFTIPPITARIGTQKAASNPLAVEVGGTDPTTTAPNKADPTRVDPPGPGEDRLFLRYKIDRATAYVGQQILLDLDVYASPQLNFQIEENAPPPTLDGFWREIVDQPQRLTRRIESVAGRSYQVYRLWRIAIFPLEAGERTIAPTQLTFAVNRSIFGGGQRDRRRAPALSIDVKPLPGEGKPANFVNGNVGTFKLTASIDHPTVPAGKAVVLTLALNGRGNLKNARLPEVSAIPGFRVFPPTTNDNITIDASGVSGEKKAEILLMPERGGRLEIPALELVTFNPETERFDRLTTPSIRVAVEGDPAALASAQTVPAAIDGSQVPKQGEPRGDAAKTELSKSELRPLRFRSTLAPHGSAPWKSAPIAALFFAPPFLFALMLLGEGLLARARRETPESRRREAARRARHRLDKAREAAEAGDGARAYHELNEALLDFASEKTGVLFRGMTTEEMKRTLEARGAAPMLVDRFTAEIEAANYARFVPGSSDARAVKTAMERWDALILELEQWTPEEAAP